jgi:hypothetical protein
MKWLRFKPWNTDRADTAARKRRQNAIDEGRIPARGLEVDIARQMEMERDGARAELAGKLFLDPVFWHDFKKGPLDNTPDLENWIDVKGTMKMHHRMPVPRITERGHRFWAYLLVYGGQHPDYCILKWCWGWEAMARVRATDPTKYIEQSEFFMKDPQELYDLVRVRQARLEPV